MSDIINIRLEGIVAPGGVNQWSREFRAQLLMNTRKAMQKVGKEQIEIIRRDVEQGLKIKRKAVVKSFVYKVYYQRTNKLPSFHFYSRIPWMGLHDKGGTISKTLYIPLTKKRIKNPYKEMKILMSELTRANNLFFEKKGKSIIAWAKNTEQFKRVLAPFRATTRSRSGKVVRKNERVNICVIIKGQTTKKRINTTNIAKQAVPKVKNEIERLFRQPNNR